MSGEINLVAYSILAQAAIGLVIMLVIGSKTLGINESNQSRYKYGFLTATVLTMVAMAVSAAHLGNSMRAMNAIFNVGSSWLSREILFNGAFFACTAGAYYLARQGKCFCFAAIAAAITGLLCVISQAAIYANTVIPAWGYGHSYLTFVPATFAMGALLGSAILLKKNEATQGIKAFGIVALTLLFVSIVTQAAYYSVFVGKLAGFGSAGIASLALLANKSTMMMASWSLLAIGFLGFACQLHKKEIGGEIYVMTILIVLGQILNRAVFYGIGVTVGM